MGNRSYLVETYLPREGLDTLPKIVDRAEAAAHEMRIDGVDVHYLHPIVVPADEICFHLFEGPSAQSIGEASRRASLAYERIVETVQRAEDSARSWERRCH